MFSIFWIKKATSEAAEGKIMKVNVKVIKRDAQYFDIFLDKIL